MKIWCLTQNTNDNYDAYTKILLTAPSAEAAKKFISTCYIKTAWELERNWVPDADICVLYIGEAYDIQKETILCVEYIDP